MTDRLLLNNEKSEKIKTLIAVLEQHAVDLYFIIIDVVGCGDNVAKVMCGRGRCLTDL